MQLRSSLGGLTLLALACANPPAPVAVPEPPRPFGISVEEEASILRLEDRRELDPAITTSWVSHSNSLHRARIALALGRIGPANFIDNDGNRERGDGEPSAGLTELVTLLSDGDPMVRRNAAFALGEIGDATATDPLFNAARDDHGDVAAEAVEALSKLTPLPDVARYLELADPSIRQGIRARCIRYLFRFADESARTATTAALDIEDPAVRREAAYATARKAHAPARAPLESLLNASDTLTRSYAARALGQIADAASIDVLIAAVADPHPWVRTNAARSIAQTIAKNPDLGKGNRVARDVAALINLTEDGDPGTRAVAIESLATWVETSEPARERLLKIATDGSRWQRELALAGLVQKLPHDLRVAPLLDEATPGAKRAVLQTATGAPAAAFVARWASDADVSVRAAAIGSIPDDGVEAKIDLLRRALNDPDVGVRASAIDRLALSKSEGVLETLRKAEERARSEASNDARVSAIRGIATLLDADASLTFLRSLLSDRDPMVRQIVAAMIKEKTTRAVAFTPLPIDRPLSEYVEIARWAQERHTASIHMTRGTIELVLLTQDAPMTTWNFATLAKKGYFDGTSFMRVVPNFVIQGGDPRNDMTGGPGYSIRDEINLQRYTRGAVGMALSGPDTGGSQFFITHSPQPHLDGGYTIFARVSGGMGGVADLVERGDGVNTITIDEKPVPSPESISGVEQPTLPLETGVTTPERLLAIVPEYPERKAAYAADASVVQMIASSWQKGDHIEVYLGTWCDDSQREVPKFLRIVDDLRTEYQIELPASYVALDRTKQHPSSLIAGKQIEKVATFIYYRGDRELGRIVEKPSSLFEDDLLVLAAGQ